MVAADAVVIQDILMALEDEELHDVTLMSADGVAVSGNRFLLAARSKVLKRMLYGNFLEAKSNRIPMLDFQSRHLNAVMEFCISNDIVSFSRDLQENEVGVRDLVRLAKAADYLEMPGLQKQIDRRLRRLISEFPQLACAVYDEDDGCSDAWCYAQQVIECRPYVALCAIDDADIGGGIECLSANNLIELMQNLNIEAGEYFLFRMLQRWLDCASDTCPESALDVARQCTKHMRFENIEPKVLLDQIHVSNIVSADQIFDAVAQQALRASKQRAWSIGCRGRDTAERVLVEGSGIRNANGVYYRIAGLANGELYTKREVCCGQQFVYMLSCNKKDELLQFRLSCTKVLTHNATLCLRSMQKSSVVDPVYQPVIQVLFVDPPEENGPTPIRKYYRIRISDGNFEMQGTLSKALDGLVESGELEENSLIKVLDFGLYILEGCPGIHISKMAVVNSNPGHVFGDPQPLSTFSEEELDNLTKESASESSGLQNLYSCEMLSSCQLNEDRIPRKGWKVDEHGLAPGPFCNWIAAGSSAMTRIKTNTPTIHSSSSYPGEANKSVVTLTP